MTDFSKISRYDFYFDCFGGCDCSLGQEPKGQYVEYKDYKKLLDEYNSLLGQLIQEPNE